MQTHLRPYLFFLFLALFAVAAPATVLYTAGYRYSFEDRKILQTGLVALESEPRGARITLDGKPLRRETPTVIGNLLPGLHKVSLKKDGYLPWEKSLEVNSRQTTFVKNIVLFAQATPVLAIPAPQGPPAPTPIDPQLLKTIRIRALAGQVAVMRQEGATSRVLAYVPNGTYRVLPSPVSETVFVQNEQSAFVFLIDTATSEEPILLSTKAPLLSWGASPHPRLLYSDGFELALYDPQRHTHETLTRVSQPITGIAWHPSGNAVFYTLRDGLYALELEEAGGRRLTPLSQGADYRDVWVDERGEHAYFFGLIQNKRGWFDRPLVQ